MVVVSVKKGKYLAPPTVFAVSKVFQHGKTQIPKEVRKALNLKNGDRVLWYSQNGLIFVKRLESELARTATGSWVTS